MSDAGPWISIGTASRMIVGWFSIVIGLLNLLADADRRAGQPDLTYLLFHGVLVLGGCMLLALGRLAEDPGPIGYAVGGAVAAIGLLASALPTLNAVCCMFGYAVRHGFPFSFLARAEGDAARWQADIGHLLADLLFWGYAGLLALVLVALFRRFTSAHDKPEPADQPSPADRTVGGLP